jgi:hypothetical protein
MYPLHTFLPCFTNIYSNITVQRSLNITPLYTLNVTVSKNISDRDWRVVNEMCVLRRVQCFFIIHFLVENSHRLIYEGVSKSFRTGCLERELQMVQLSATRCSCIAILWVSLVSFATITVCVASQRVLLLFISLSTQSGNFWIQPCKLCVLANKHRWKLNLPYNFWRGKRALVSSKYISLYESEMNFYGRFIFGDCLVDAELIFFLVMSPIQTKD